MGFPEMHGVLGKVDIPDYDRDVFNSANVLNGLAHEREVRAVIWKTAPGDPPFRLMGDQGIVVPVDHSALFQEIFVSPDSKPMFRDVVQDLVIKYGLNVPVRLSTVNDPPPY